MMNSQQLLQLVIDVMLIVSFLVGCGTTTPTPLFEVSTLTSLTAEPETGTIITPTSIPSTDTPMPEIAQSQSTLTYAPEAGMIKPSPERPTPTSIPSTDTTTPRIAPPQLPLSTPSKVVFASGSNIYTVDVENNKPTSLVQVNEQLCCPRWSPDRQKIAFAIGGGMHYGVYVVDADGSNLKRLTYVQRFDGDRPPLSPVWAEDSQHIDFVYGAYGYGGLNEVASPDGQYIAFVTTRSENDQLVYELYVKNVDGAGVPKLITTTQIIWGIDW